MWDEEQDELDRILNRALSTYPAEPLLGIEARVLRRVRNEGRVTQRSGLTSSFWGRAMGAGLAAALLAGGVFLSRNGLVEKPANQNHSIAERQVNSPKTGADATPPAGATQGNQEVEGTIRVKASRSALPKLDVFPTPAPLTLEELALVKMTRGVPSGATTRLDKAGAVPPEPIQIQVLEIKPLVVDDVEEGEKRSDDR